jgi:hypothetical protein
MAEQLVPNLEEMDSSRHTASLPTCIHATFPRRNTTCVTPRTT